MDKHKKIPPIPEQLKSSSEPQDRPLDNSSSKNDKIKTSKLAKSQAPSPSLPVASTPDSSNGNNLPPFREDPPKSKLGMILLIILLLGAGGWVYFLQTQLKDLTQGNSELYAAITSAKKNLKQAQDDKQVSEAAKKLQDDKQAELQKKLDDLNAQLATAQNQIKTLSASPTPSPTPVPTPGAKSAGSAKREPRLLQMPGAVHRRHRDDTMNYEEYLRTQKEQSCLAAALLQLQKKCQTNHPNSIPDKKVMSIPMRTGQSINKLVYVCENPKTKAVVQSFKAGPYEVFNRCQESMNPEVVPTRPSSPSANPPPAAPPGSGHSGNMDSQPPPAFNPPVNPPNYPTDGMPYQPPPQSFQGPISPEAYGQSQMPNN